MTTEELRAAFRRETNRLIIVVVLSIWIAQALAFFIARTIH
jgi:hypothetical protein